MDNFETLRIVDNFYQTSAFFPMPTILVSTVSPNGMTNLGSYSLCFPYYIAGKDYYAMVLECRNSSNTCQNILRTKKCSLNFIPDDKRYFREAVRLGFPGDTTEEKMKDCLFTLSESDLGADRPKVVDCSFQVFECTWDDSLENAFEDKPGILDGYPALYPVSFPLRLNDDTAKEYLFEFLFSGAYAVVDKWVEEGCKTDAAEIGEILFGIFKRNFVIR